jgi:hypothetical protein
MAAPSCMPTATVAHQHGRAYDDAENLPTATAQTTSRRYKWRTGDCIETYGTSANVWREYTSTADFAAAFSAIVEDDTIPNETRSARAEQFLLDQAT